MRIQSNDYGSWKEDLRGIADLKRGESAISGLDLAERINGRDSEEHYAARIIREYHVLERLVQAGDHEMATYIAIRLGELLAEADMAPLARQEWERARGLREVNLSRREKGQERKARILALASGMKDGRSTMTKNAIAKALARQEAKMILFDHERGSSPSEAQIQKLADQLTRQIRKYLERL